MDDAGQRPTVVPIATAAIPTPDDNPAFRIIARKMYYKMPVPLGVTRVPWEKLDADATKLWLLLAKAAVEALNEADI